MRILYIGTGDIGLPALNWLIGSGHEIAAIVTQPDKPAGRSMELRPSPVKQVALDNNIPVLEPVKIRDPVEVERIRAIGADLIVVMAYGQILPRGVLEAAQCACLNLHASILPRHRGAAPIQAAILFGDRETGITVMYMDQGLDTGEILLIRRLSIYNFDTGGSLDKRLAATAPKALADAIALLESGTAPRIPQDDALATYAKKLGREDGAIPWERPSRVVSLHIRAMNPWPGAFTLLPDKGGAPRKLKVFGARRGSTGFGRPGEVLYANTGGILVACGSGSILLREVQLEGKRRMPVRDFLAGRSVAPGVILEPPMETVIDPFTGEVAGRYDPADLPSVRAALDSARAAFDRTRRIPAAERSALLSRIAALISARGESLAQLIRAEAGKPVSLARAEVERAAQTFRFAAEEAAVSGDRVIEIDASPPGKNHTGVARRVPIGVILGISPFNFPLNLVAHKVAPCIATGNTMLLKPSPRTPLTALALADILSEAGAPPGQVRILPFDHRLIPGLIEDSSVKMLSFTGSAAVGWDLKRLAVRQKVTLELGGNAAVIVHSDAAWPAAIPGIAAAAFGYSGQSCISVQRILVHSEIYGSFRDAFLRHVESAIRTGNPADESIINGPMIDLAARDRVLAWVREALERGATSALPLRHEGNCLWPIVLEHVPQDARISSEEAFGPVALLSRYDTFDAALAQVNASRYGLQAGVFTSAIDLAEHAFGAIDAGAVLINQVPTFRVENMPYGGVKDSGFGREGIRYAMEEMTEWKSFIVRLPSTEN